MRKPRIKYAGDGYYHVFSRCVFNKPLFDETERDFFVQYLRKAELFCGVQVLAYCVMPSHFNLLVHVGNSVEISEEEILYRIKVLNGDAYAATTRIRWQEYRERNELDRLEAEINSYKKRTCDLTQFVKTFLQHLSIRFRAVHKLQGTMWSSRFKSILVEGTSDNLSTVAAYIDLYPVRAGIVEDPKDYKWSSYGAACNGDDIAMLGLASLYKVSDVTAMDFADRYDELYRSKLYINDEEKLDDNQIQKIIKDNGKLPLPYFLRCEVRYFTDSSILGSNEFVKESCKEFKNIFSENRKRDASRVANSADKLYSDRNLQKDRVIYNGKSSDDK